jgi:hypothetical protein
MTLVAGSNPGAANGYNSVAFIYFMTDELSLLPEG